jgi:hypothetical protein
MALEFVDRPAVHSTWYPDRPIRGVTLHDTEGSSDLTTHQSAGGWHWLVGRAGTIYRDCSESQAAWHVLKADRWRPGWLVPSPDGLVSDANYCTIGIEITSGPLHRAAGEPYTDAQYGALRALLADIYQRHGQLPVVFHGDLQSDRSDPVQFDPVRAGLAIQREREYLFTGDAGTGVAGTGTTTATDTAPVALLADEQIDRIGQAVFGDVPFIRQLGLSDAWLSQLRAGNYRGAPQGPETALGAIPGAVYQVFRHGVAFWTPDEGVAWFPPARLPAEELRPVAETVFGNVQFTPELGLADAWIRELGAGRYRGRPLGGEQDLPLVAGARFQLFEYGVAIYLPGRGVSWTAFAGETAPPAGVDETITADTTLLAPTRATLAQAQAYLLSQPNGSHSAAEVEEIVRLYFETAEPVGLDPCLVVAQMVHETGFLSSFWSQAPRRNPAGIGVTGEPGAGIAFPSWPVAVRAHIGRLLAYALARVQENDVQRALIEEALAWRPLPDHLRGAAPTLRSLAGTWAADLLYAQKVGNHANRLRAAQVLQPVG